MTDNQKLAAGAALVVTAVVLTIKDVLNIRRIERETRTKIANETARNLAAQIVATERVVQNIQEGKYEPGDLDAVVNDFKFENIIARTRIEDV